MNREFFVYGLTEPGMDLVRYVGYAADLKRRLREHLCEASKQGHTHRLHWLRGLLAAGKKPGIVILEKTTKELCKEREIHWISELKSKNRLTNSTDGGDGMLNPPEDLRRRIGEASRKYNSTRTRHPNTGHKHTEEAKARMSLSQMGNTNGHGCKGIPKSEEHRAKIGSGNQGKVRSPETKALMHETNKGKNRWSGRHHTEEARARISASKLGKTPWLGKHHTEKTKVLIGDKSRGRKFTEETRAKMSAAMLGNRRAAGHRHSELSKLRMGLSRLGNRNAAGNHKPKSLEHRAAIAAALRARHAARLAQAV